MRTNDLKKGDRVVMRNGWHATIMDNKRGNTRVATVEGFSRDTGSVYVWDIDRTESGEAIELTPAQVKARDTVKALGF
jgi:hypothetical protein